MGNWCAGVTHHRGGVASRRALDAQALRVDGDRHDLACPACSTISRCTCQPGSSSAIALDAAAAQRAAGEREALHEAGADQHVLGVGGGAAHAPEVVGERFAQLRNAARVAVAERRRAASRAAPSAASAASGRAGKPARSGRPGWKW